MGLSIRGYAKHRGVTEGAVRYALKSGRITRGSDGKIDPIKADSSWEDNTNHAKRPVGHLPIWLRMKQPLLHQ